MYATGNKKMLNMLILEILKEYTDEDHSLTQQEIIKLLDKNYGMECDRRSVKNNILYLKELGYDISSEKGYRLLSRDFEDAELRMMIDSVLFSKSLSAKQAKGLVEKIRSLGSRYFSAKVTHICNLPELQHSDNKQVLYVLDTINEAIDKHKKISFTYNNYGTDFKLHARKEEKYVVNPFQLVANNGRYYLIGNYDKYDNISHYRIDRMTDVSIIDLPRKPSKEIIGLEKGLNLPKHMAEHIYMFSGSSTDIIMFAEKHLMSEMVDWFGKDFTILEENNDLLKIRVSLNENAAYYWALQYGPYVEIIEPVTLRKRLSEDIRSMAGKYDSCD